MGREPGRPRRSAPALRSRGGKIDQHGRLGALAHPARWSSAIGEIATRASSSRRSRAGRRWPPSCPRSAARSRLAGRVPGRLDRPAGGAAAGGAAERRMPPQLRTGTAALVGKQAMVLERIANDEGVGCVRIEGEVWTARAYDEDEVYRGGQARAGRRDPGRDGARDRIGRLGMTAGAIALIVARGVRALRRRVGRPDRAAGPGRDRGAARPLQPHAATRADARSCRSSTA